MPPQRKGRRGRMSTKHRQFENLLRRAAEFLSRRHSRSRLKVNPRKYREAV